MDLKRAILLILFSVVCYFPLFLHLDSEDLYHWDEARNGINTLEMIQHGNPLVRTYNGEPETWETKPPLLIWLQAIAVKIAGPNELGIRLPSAIAALFTIFFIFRFFVKDLDDIIGGVFAGLTLVCTQGYIGFHVVRTGDHDALLCLFQTLIVLYFFKYLKSGLKNNQYLGIAVASVIMGVLTKSIMGFAMLPGIVFYTFYKKYFITLFKKKSFWFSILAVITSIGAYYFAREQYQPGYLQLVWENELFPRFFNTAEGHNYKKAASKFYYLNVITTEHFKYLSFLFPVLLILVYLKGEAKQKLIFTYVLFCALAFLIFISFGTTNGWYDAPIFPLLAILTGIGCSVLLRLVFSFLKTKTIWKQIAIGSIFTLLIFSIPYSKIIQKVYKPDDNRDQYGTFLNYLEKKNIKENLFTYYIWRNSSYIFYEKAYKDFRGWDISSCGYRGKFDRCETQPGKGHKIIICSGEIKNAFEKSHTFEIIDKLGRCRLYRIKND